MGVRTQQFAADRLRIRPCIACSSCSGRTYGRCVLPDDMQHLYPHIAGCRALVLVSPLLFGSVSHHIKKVMDRMSALGDPRYHYSDGELVKGMRGQGMRYYMLGIGDGPDEAQRRAFCFLHEENRRIMNVEGRAFVLDSRFQQAELTRIAEEIGRG